jgi:hypothetical protein
MGSSFFKVNCIQGKLMKYSRPSGIASSAVSFFGCISLATVSTLDSVKKIERRAFAETCLNLLSVSKETIVDCPLDFSLLGLEQRDD